MARRYARDNRGRFASGGSGATARGGRLRTAAGNKRATQTKRLAGGKPAGTIGKSRNPSAPPAPAAKSAASRRRRPTAAESRANGLIPISDIRARQAAQAAERDASRLRRTQSNMTRARGQQVASQGKQRAPYGRYSTIKNPAAEGSFPQMAPGRSGLGMSQAAKGRAAAAAKPRRAKSDQQVMQQADRVMGKLAKRMKTVIDGGGDLSSKMAQIQRNNRRGGRVNAALSRRGLLDRYQKATAGADFIHGTSAGKGIRGRRR